MGSAAPIRSEETAGVGGPGAAVGWKALAAAAASRGGRRGSWDGGLSVWGQEEKGDSERNAVRVMPTEPQELGEHKPRRDWLSILLPTENVLYTDAKAGHTLCRAWIALTAENISLAHVHKKTFAAQCFC
jgi:hypothetical protein